MIRIYFHIVVSNESCLRDLLCLITKEKYGRGIMTVFMEVQNLHWPLAVESTVLASVNAFYFLHRVRFGGPSEGGLCATGRDSAEQVADASDSSDFEELRACKGKRGSPWSSGAGAIPQRPPKLLKY